MYNMYLFIFIDLLSFFAGSVYMTCTCTVYMYNSQPHILIANDVSTYLLSGVRPSKGLQIIYHTVSFYKNIF